MIYVRRAPKSNSSDAGDFASVLFTVLRDRSSDSGDLTVAEANDFLDEFSRVGSSDEGRRGQERVWREIFTRTTALQQKWLVRIVLKDLKWGIGQKVRLLITFGSNMLLTGYFPFQGRVQQGPPRLRRPVRR